MAKMTINRVNHTARELFLLGSVLFKLVMGTRCLDYLKLLAVVLIKRWQLLVFATCSYVLMSYRDYFAMEYSVRYRLDTDFVYNVYPRHFDAKSVSLHYASQCACRSQLVHLKLNNTSDEYTVWSSHISSRTQTFMYSIPRRTLESAKFTCNMYSWLRRGRNLKVISYSLTGTAEFYYKFVKSLIKRIHELYPDWIVRIHYDATIHQPFVCEIECLRDERTGTYYDNVDFCNVEELPFDLRSTWNASYMHAMTYRWLSIGDSFVDFWASRDTGAWVSKRELDSVRVWLNSSNVFHIMRDSPVHNVPIVGGYWGFANERNRPLAEHLFKVLTNKHVARYFNKGRKNSGGADQDILTAFVNQHSKLNSTTHDSFHCTRLGGEPWPSKRSYYNCYVGCIACCDQIDYQYRIKYTEMCPIECRPPNHLNWIHC